MSEARASRKSSETAGIVIDLDGFACLDESYGGGSADHARDTLLAVVRSQVRSSDVVRVIDGNRAALYLDDAAPGTADRIMARIEERFRQRLGDAGYDCVVGVQVITTTPEEDPEAAAALGIEPRPARRVSIDWKAVAHWTLPTMLLLAGFVLAILFLAAFSDATVTRRQSEPEVSTDAE